MSYALKLISAVYPLPKIRDVDGKMKELHFEDEVVFKDIPEWIEEDNLVQVRHLVDEHKTKTLLERSAKPSKRKKKLRG